MLSLLSVIPLAANDHDLIEPRANDFDTVHEEEAKATLYQIRDSKDKIEVGDQIIEDAENDAVDPSTSSTYAQHEQVDNSEGDGDKQSQNVEGEVEGDGKDGEGSPKQPEKSSEKRLKEDVVDAEDSNTDEVSSGTHNADTNETSESNEIGKQEDDGDVGVSKTGADRADGAEKIDEKKRPKEEGSKPVEIDYANKSTGALILDKSKNFQGTSNLLVADKDKYAMIPCDQGDGVKFVTVGLSEDILVKSIKLSSNERYSSLTKRFQVLGSQTYPVMSEWEDLGTFDAKPWYKENKEQIFDLVQPSWSRYLKFRFLDHYGDEHYCAYTQIKVHGSTTLQGFHEMQLEENEAAEAEAVAEAAQAVIDEIESAASIPPAEPDSKAEVEKVDEAVVDVKLSDASTEGLKEGDEDGKEENTLAVPEPVDNSNADDYSEVSDESNNSSAVVSEQDLPDTKSSVATTDAKPVAVESLTENKEHHSDEKMDGKDAVEEVAVQKNTDLVVEDSLTRKDIDRQEQNVSVEKDDEILESSEPTDVPETKGVEEEEDTMQSTSSVTNAVKKATMMKDAVKEGINQIMKSKAIGDNEDDGNIKNVEQENTDESAESKYDHVSDADSSDPNVTADSTDAISYPIKSSTIDPKGGVVEFGSEIVVTAGAGSLNASTTASSTNANNDTAAREALKAAEEMLSLLSEQFPSAKCLDYLDFSEFKKRSIDAASQKASQKSAAQGEKSKISASKNEPIFKKLTDEIKSLQASQGVYEQYIKSATTCYQRVILDLGNDLVTKQNEQEERMRILEDQMRTFVEEEQSKRITAKDLMVTVKSIAAKILSFISKTCPMIFSWYSYLKTILCAIAERILGNEHVQRIIYLVVAYQRDVKTFLFGVLFCYLFVERTKWVQSNTEGKKGNKRRRRKFPKSSLLEDSPPRDIPVSSLRTDEEEESY